MHRWLQAAKHHPYATSIPAVFVLACALTILLWPSASQRPAAYHPQIRARIYTSYTMCLLTDQNGATGAQAAPVWAGMQAASTATKAQIQDLAISIPTDADADVNALALRGCDLILAAGPGPTNAVNDRADAFPRLHFISVDPRATPSANTTTITSTDADTVSATVQTLATNAAHGLYPTDQETP